MSRGALIRVAVLSVLAALALAGCGDDGTTASSPVATAAARDDSAGVMAAAIRRLISRDHTFGRGTHRFSEYLIQERTDRTAGAPAGGDAPPSRSLTAAERAAIAEVVAPFGPFRFVADAGAWRTDDLQPRIAGSVILGVGEPEIAGDRALAPVSLWCGGLCGTWLTYRVVRAGDAWRVTGIEGPVAIS
ncbi:MAG: hypothetical protein JHC74_04085 [Thermoleophilia bacterium]|nr:hypothetical protein [Thermoleophilia bacterium]